MYLTQCSTACRATRADARRGHLVDTARRLFTERGFHATGVAQIAAASGIRVGQIYRDFQCKEDIVAAIAAADLATFLDEEGLDAAAATGDRLGVRSWIRRFIDADVPIEKCRMTAEIVAEAARNARVATIHRDIDWRIRGLIVRALTVLAPDTGRAEDRRRVADLILTLGTGLKNRRIADPELDVAALAGRLNAIVDGEIARLADCDAEMAPAGCR